MGGSHFYKKVNFLKKKKKKANVVSNQKTSKSNGRGRKFLIKCLSKMCNNRSLIERKRKRGREIEGRREREEKRQEGGRKEESCHLRWFGRYFITWSLIQSYFPFHTHPNIVRKTEFLLPEMLFPFTLKTSCLFKLHLLLDTHSSNCH